MPRRTPNFDNSDNSGNSDIINPGKNSGNGNRRGYTVAEASQYSRATQWAVRTAIRNGQLKARAIGRRLIILREDVDAWLDSTPVISGSDTPWLRQRQQKQKRKSAKKLELCPPVAVESEVA